MRNLPRAYLKKFKAFALKKMPFVLSVISFVFLLTLSLAFLALPARASLDSSTQIKKLNDTIVLNFPFPIQRGQVEIAIYPNVGFEYEWSGVLVNQNLIITPTQLLQPDETYIIDVKNIQNPLGSSKSNKTFTIRTESLPKILTSYPDPSKGRVKPNPVFSFTFDKVVEYGSFKLNSRPNFETTYNSNGRTIEFLPQVDLKQGKEYYLNLQFEAPGLTSTTLFEGDFLVVKPLKIVKTIPKQDIQNVSKKTKIKLKFNKALKPLFLGSYIKIKPFNEVQFEIVGKKTIEITPKPKFKTDTDYRITVGESIEAIDGATLENDFKLNFNVAGPVTAISSTPSGFGIPLSSLISITFDQKVDKKTAEEKFSTQPNLAGTFNWSGNTMTFIPSSVLALFKQYSFTLAKGIKGPGGEPSNKKFNFDFTTTSERKVTIGKSVKGRPISAYYFGVGAKKILLVGSQHGTEANTKDLLSGWVSYLRANQNLISSDRTFIIVPNSNPDGVAKENRFNARGVDLNRNWGTSTWEKDTYWTYGKVTGGGGSKPFSEPETKALRDLILRENPKIIVSYHSAAGIVISAGDSNSFRDWYSKKTGYSAIAGAPKPAEEVFDYNVTGSLEEWQGEKRGKVIIVVELATNYDSEYLRNLPALKGLFSYKL